MKLELTPQAEKGLMQSILDLIARFLESYTKPEPRILGLISRQQAMKELDIKTAQTFRDWEQLGLRAYQPPLDKSRVIYYKVSDLLTFLGVEDD